jgi:glycosyltransferase involved in cell wall biosynthesis
MAARAVGLESYLVSESGRNTYARIDGIPQLPFLRYAERRPTDVCVYTDVFSWMVPDSGCFAIVYEQSPRFIRNDFDHRSPRLLVWTDSDYMRALCERAYPGISIDIVPNIVDHKLFRFVPQSQRKAGELIAFPRKGPEFIDATMAAYRNLGGNFWQLQKIDGLTIGELGRRFRTPQAFLASADVEGCALPPQECMASGILVVGKNANGANFVMQHEKTALVANTPEEAAKMLMRAEDHELRTRLTRQGFAAIKRYFSNGDPAILWKKVAIDPRILQVAKN